MTESLLKIQLTKSRHIKRLKGLILVHIIYIYICKIYQVYIYIYIYIYINIYILDLLSEMLVQFK